MKKIEIDSKVNIGKKGIIGISGEYFVAAELSQMGIVATLTLKNTPKVDILATNLENGKFVNIQVKTMSVQNNQGWRLSSKDEEVSSIKNLFYVFVNLKGQGSLPEYFIIPQSKLARLLYDDHRAYLSNNKNHKDSTIRVFDPYRRKKIAEFAVKYKDNWKVLKLK